MRRQGGGFGVVMLLVVVAIVLYLATRSWRTALPTAAEMAAPATTAGGSGTPESGESPPVRPSLREMKTATDSHTSAVSEGLEQAQ
jgi:hypothetical protein